MERTKLMACSMALPLLLVAALPSNSHAEQIGWWFEAVSWSGEVMTGRFSYDTDTPPSYPAGGPVVGGAQYNPPLAYPTGFEVTLRGYTYSYVNPLPDITAIGGVRYAEFNVGNRDPGPGGDHLLLAFPFPGLSFGGPSFRLYLADDDGDALSGYLRLPATLDLSLFETTSVQFRADPDWPGFGGPLTSLTPGAPPVTATSFPAPEPGSAVLLACGLAGMGLGAVQGRRRRRATPSGGMA